MQYTILYFSNQLSKVILLMNPFYMIAFASNQDQMTYAITYEMGFYVFSPKIIYTC